MNILEYISNSKLACFIIVVGEQFVKYTRDPCLVKTYYRTGHPSSVLPSDPIPFSIIYSLPPSMPTCSSLSLYCSLASPLSLSINLPPTLFLFLYLFCPSLFHPLFVFLALSLLIFLSLYFCLPLPLSLYSIP